MSMKHCIRQIEILRTKFKELDEAFEERLKREQGLKEENDRLREEIKNLKRLNRSQELTIEQYRGPA